MGGPSPPLSPPNVWGDDFQKPSAAHKSAVLGLWVFELEWNRVLGFGFLGFGF